MSRSMNINQLIPAVSRAASKNRCVLVGQAAIDIINVVLDYHDDICTVTVPLAEGMWNYPGAREHIIQDSRWRIINEALERNCVPIEIPTYRVYRRSIAWYPEVVFEMMVRVRQCQPSQQSDTIEGPPVRPPQEG